MTISTQRYIIRMDLSESKQHSKSLSDVVEQINAVFNNLSLLLQIAPDLTSVTIGLSGGQQDSIESGNSVTIKSNVGKLIEETQMSEMSIITAIKLLKIVRHQASNLNGDSTVLSSYDKTVIFGFHVLNRAETLWERQQDVVSKKNVRRLYRPIYDVMNDIESIIGDHVVVSDKKRLQIMVDSLGEEDNAIPQLNAKKQVVLVKMNLNTRYHKLINEIKDFQDGVLSFTSKAKTVQGKKLCGDLRQHYNTLKGFSHFCEEVVNNNVQEDWVKSVVDSTERFYREMTPKVLSLVYDVKQLNVTGGSDGLADHYKTDFDQESISSFEKTTDEFAQQKTLSTQIGALLSQIVSIGKSFHMVKPNILHLMKLKFIEREDDPFLLGLKLMHEDGQLIPPFRNTDSLQNVEKLIKIYPYITQQPATMMMSAHKVVSDTVLKKIHLVEFMHYPDTLNVPNTSNSCMEFEASANKHPLYKSMIVQDPVTKRTSFHNWSSTSTELSKEVTNYIRTRISKDDGLAFQMNLLYETINYLSTVLKINKTKDDSDVEYHIKGGFCRDLILSFLSERATTSVTLNSTLFKKSVKDIDVAMNIDPEIFTYYMCKVCVEKFGLIPIKRWNNAEKSDKGKNISVWSVKLLEDYEPMEFVHFRTDDYDPVTSAVTATDIYSSLQDDLRRDVPWPSFRLNDMMIVDYFDVLGMLNRGEFFVRTPPKASSAVIVRAFGDTVSVSPVNISDTEVNYDTHTESAERVIRLFKFVSSPFDAHFAFNYDLKTKTFLNTNTDGFSVHPDLVNMYMHPHKDSELRASSEIRRYMKQWLNGGILANVFKSISKTVSNSPYQFIKFMIDFNILNNLFDNNYDTDTSLEFSLKMEKMLKSSNMKLVHPYIVMGVGVKSIDLMLSHMKLLGLSSDTQYYASFVARNAKVLFADVCDKNARDKVFFELLSETSNSYRVAYTLDLMKMFGYSRSSIDVEKYINYLTETKISDKIRSCVISTMSELVLFLLFDTDKIANTSAHTQNEFKEWINNRSMYHLANLITRSIGVPGAKDDHPLTDLDRLFGKRSDMKFVRSLIKDTVSQLKESINVSSFDQCIEYIECYLDALTTKLGVDSLVDTTFIESFNKKFCSSVFNVADALNRLLRSEDEVDRLKKVLETDTSVQNILSTVGVDSVSFV
ncbi:hypothetical protein YASMINEVIRUS_1091 [Yasminevirus sp. GU-2018]|uniref:Uncharacterized protein n=1 Tax=Yasminevirus sp. GU-2018 TaxID=2420051 RepID=A0A5K0U8Y4_9VIRU|nr:hypothetical protein YASMINEVIRUS_1091 [Yasminevirus sp. GU-2018]